MLDDLLFLANKYSIKNPINIIKNTVEAIDLWKENAQFLNLENHLIESFAKDFIRF